MNNITPKKKKKKKKKYLPSRGKYLGFNVIKYYIQLGNLFITKFSQFNYLTKLNSKE